MTQPIRVSFVVLTMNRKAELQNANLGIPLGKRKLLGISIHNWSTPYLVETKQILQRLQIT